VQEDLPAKNFEPDYVALETLRALREKALTRGKQI
jgi:hypothetical protein